MKLVLDDWSIVCKNPYQAPELQREALDGLVSGHPNFDDNERITTSYIIGKRNGKVVTYSGSEYELKAVSPDYEEMYPNARERLFNSLEEI